MDTTTAVEEIKSQLAARTLAEGVSNARFPLAAWVRRSGKTTEICYVVDGLVSDDGAREVLVSVDPTTWKLAPRSYSPEQTDALQARAEALTGVKSPLAWLDLPRADRYARKCAAESAACVALGLEDPHAEEIGE